MPFKFLQKIFTPKGPAIFLAYVLDLEGDQLCQVSRRVSALEFSKDICLRCKPDLVNYSHEDFAAWQKSAVVVVNEIYRTDEINEKKPEAIAA